MSFKPVQIFGFIMSFAYVFFGLLFLMTPLFSSAVEDPQYRKMFGAAIVTYGLFRVGYFVRQFRKKS